MAKAKSKGSIWPLIILFLVLTVLAGVGFVVYSIVQGVSDTTKKKMERKNISMHRSGMTVGVKEVSAEQYEDKTQECVFRPFVSCTMTDSRYSMLVKMWGNSNFKGRFDTRTAAGSAGSSPASTPGVGTEKRKP